ncbi:hypothetical protein CK203_023681 [Vitis vinifera]|uniref:Uncharacterized protein n=1 Tax=Vitis vinifera TaxID=29760 RepID=A0A438JBP0_VITVI|nr:hypothetical protein CK203_023681 [Vitis vinifera]
MVMMEKQTRTDRISNLPWDVLDAILVHLPLKMPQGLASYQKNHSGPIEKFKLAAYCCPNHLDLDQWMHFLAEKGIKEFVLKEFYFIRRFKLPCCLFSCQQLRHLELVLGCLSGVKRFSLSGHFLEFLGTSNVPERLPERFNRLMALELREVSFKSLNEVMVFLAILQSSPNLEELSISHRDLEVGSYDIPIVEFLKSRYLLGSLNHLQVVRIRGIMVSRPEWELIKLILASSPALKTMTIVKYRGSRIPESVFLQVERASENAKIISLTL